MRALFLSLFINLILYTPEVLADIPSGGDKTGCSTIGTFDIAYVLLPIVLLGLLTFFRKPKKIEE